MSDFKQWESRHPLAALELKAMMGAVPWPDNDETSGKSESWAQQQVRFKVAHAGGMLWRNNVGASKTRCSNCGAKQQPVRYGLANDSANLNRVIKSSDLIGAVPRVIRGCDVGRTIAQFVSIEVKKPGWSFRPGDAHEAAQAKWLTLIASLGGVATFSTGDIDL